MRAAWIVFGCWVVLQPFTMAWSQVVEPVGGMELKFPSLQTPPAPDASTPATSKLTSHQPAAQEDFVTVSDTGSHVGDAVHWDSGAEAAVGDQMGPQPLYESADGYIIADDCSSGYCGADCDSCGHPGLLPSLFGGLFDDCYRYGSFWREVHSGNQFWVDNEVLVWAGKGSQIPPLVTTSPVGVPQSVAGVLGQPNTSIVYGDEGMNEDVRGGWRITAGYYLVPGQFWAVVGDYYRLGDGGDSPSFFSDGNPTIARPFYNTQLGVQDASISAFQNFDSGGTLINLQGGVGIDSYSEIQSAGAGLRTPIWVDFNTNYRVSLVGGYRYYGMDEGLTINETIRPVGGFFAPGTELTATDVFETRNDFQGGEVGAIFEYRYCRLSVEVLGRLGMGNMRRQVTINGYNSVFDSVNRVWGPGGLLAQPTNMGTYEHDEFSLIPEVGVKLGWQLSDKWRISAGYTFIHVNNVVRPGDQIDLSVNPSQITGPLVGDARPMPLFNDTSFWLQGANFGLEARF